MTCEMGLPSYIHHTYEVVLFNSTAVSSYCTYTTVLLQKECSSSSSIMLVERSIDRAPALQQYTIIEACCTRVQIYVQLMHEPGMHEPGELMYTT